MCRFGLDFESWLARGDALNWVVSFDAMRVRREASPACPLSSHSSHELAEQAFRMHVFR